MKELVDEQPKHEENMESQLKNQTIIEKQTGNDKKNQAIVDQSKKF